MTDYTLMPPHYPGITLHDDPQALLLHDGSDIDMNRVELIANVRSGDYLVTLATTLDIISQLLLDANHAERDNLQKIVNDLLYLSSRYDLHKKTSI